MTYDEGIIVVGDFSKCVVYDMSGKVVDTLRRPRGVDVKAGMYFVVATASDGSTVTKKVIVK